MTHLLNFTFKNQNHLVLNSKSVKNQHISYRFKIELTYLRNFREENFLFLRSCCNLNQVPVNTLTGGGKKKKVDIETPINLSELWSYIPMLIPVLYL